MYQRLKRLSESGSQIAVAVVGSGYVGRGLAYQLSLTPGMRCAAMVARNPDRGVEALVRAGYRQESIVATDQPDEIQDAISRGLTVVAPSLRGVLSAPDLNVIVEATGHVAFGADVAVEGILSGKHVVSLNYETDATVGPILDALAREIGVVYTGSDGDQPGVMMRMFEYVQGIGLDVVAAVNCKGFMDVHATPDSIRPWAEKQGTSLHMTTAFTDGTKMNVENASVANATGLLPDKRGMHGIETTLESALADFADTLDSTGVVEYTLGGNFGGGVFVIGSGADPELSAPYLSYLKMGPGPWYLFYRPWHLVHMETAMSIAEAYLDGIATIKPAGPPVARVATIAKRSIEPGRRLDGIGGFDCYGEIEAESNATDFLPIGLADLATTVNPLARDEPIRWEDVEIVSDSRLVALWKAQQDLEGLTGTVSERASRIWNST